MVRRKMRPQFASLRSTRLNMSQDRQLVSVEGADCFDLYFLLFVGGQLSLAPARKPAVAICFRLVGANPRQLTQFCRWEPRS